MEGTQKTCRVCGEVKPSGKFDKHRNVCRQCRNTGERREKNLQRRRELNARRPDLKQKANRAYYLQNAEAIKDRYRAMPHLRWVTEYRRRVARLGLEIGPIEEFTKADVVALYGDACHYCGGDFLEIDHAVPISKGGPHTLANVRPACPTCNRSKGTKVLADE